ncbi:CATRA system-associated protein [Nonomuraea sp. 3N208]|uniref:CATRA system-associated protein n=1 Tax=Nonomuraea sp. 3N208 TaxID=3457421 RepID=UPI003FCCFE4B
MGAHGEAVKLLRDALTWWTMPPANWADVAVVIDRMGSSGDVAAELGHLELAGPMRISTWYGDQPVVPMPEELRERVNELIHALTPDAEDADGAG